MLFNSLIFIFAFLPLALGGFWLAARIHHRVAAAWLVLASLAFYAYWKISFLPVLLVSICFNFAVSRFIAAAEQRPRLQQALLIGGVGANILALIYFKYLVSLVGFLNAEGLTRLSIQEIVLPLGISFFTFTQIGYLVDVKQGVAKPRDPLTYALFVTFFPHLIAGPILHNREMIPQFLEPNTYRFSGQNTVIGLTIFSIGLVKKVLLADPLSNDVEAGFAAADTAGLWIAWQTVIAYSLQLYFDFSGYCDMAIGLARMFNVRFPLNFNSPYKSVTVVEYWQRFHMTLTRFITMYIYTPIALWITRRQVSRGRDVVNRKSTIGGFASAVAVPTMITMTLAGIWHGAGFQYVIFGLLHGTYIIINHFSRLFLPPAKPPAERGSVQRAVIHVTKVLSVYLAALVAFAFFRAPSTEAAINILAGMAGFRGIGHGMARATAALIAIQLGIVWLAPNTQQIMKHYEPALGRVSAGSLLDYSWSPSPWWGYACGILAALGILAIGGSTEFLYFQF